MSIFKAKTDAKAVIISKLTGSLTFTQFVKLLSLPILRTMSYAVPLKTRLQLFESIVRSNREAIQGTNANQNLQPGINVSITRSRELEDGMRYLDALGERMKQRIIVNYRNEAGVLERGIDVGGLFKEVRCEPRVVKRPPDAPLLQG